MESAQQHEDLEVVMESQIHTDATGFPYRLQRSRDGRWRAIMYPGRECERRSQWNVSRQNAMKWMRRQLRKAQ